MKHGIVAFAFVASLVACGPVEDDPASSTPTPTPTGTITPTPTPTATPTPTPVPNTHSLSFDGVDDHVVVPNHASFNSFTAYTIEAWVKPSSTGSLGVILAKNTANTRAEFQLERTGLEQAKAATGGPTSSCTASSTSVPQGEWTHVASTWSSPGAPRVYIGGTLVDTSACTTTMTNTLAEIVLGAERQNGTLQGYFAGNLDEVRVWSVARTQPQIAASMTSKLDGDEAGLAAYWSFDEGSGDAIGSPSGAGGQLGASSGADASDPVWSTDKPF